MYYVHSPVRTRCRWLFEKYKSLLGAGATEKQIHYAAFLETMDAYIGQLLQALESTGQSENTLVIFLSDNGGHPDRKSTRLELQSLMRISYAVFCLKKKK